jgi:hypothetical protein
MYGSQFSKIRFWFIKNLRGLLGGEKKISLIFYVWILCQHLNKIYKFLWMLRGALLSIVFRPGSNSRFWLGNWVVRVSFFKSKRRRFSKKKTKVNGLQPSFFFNPVRLQSRVGRVPDRSAGLGQVFKLYF